MSNDASGQVLSGPVYDFSHLGFAPDEVIVVTGSGSGIGRAIAITAAKSGLAVGVWDMNAEGAAETVALITEAGGRALAVTANVGDDGEVAKAWDATAQLGPCRYLVNNAAPSAVSEMSFYDHLLLTVGSAYRVATSWMELHGSACVSGVNIASVAGNFMGGKIKAHYPAGKGGIAALTRHLAVKYQGSPRFNTVAPGSTLTPRTSPYVENEDYRIRTARIPMGRSGYSEEIASAVMFLLSPAASYVNGVLLPVDGGWVLS
jgi:NAD(P)-dependent dehydrogenase (short-subunit alcohol dehydrogenase family)